MRVAVALLVVLAVTVGAVLVVAPGAVGIAPPGDQGLAQLIESAADTSRVLDLEALAPFEWDRMVVVQPYTTVGGLEAGGLDWPVHWKWSDIWIKDDRVFLVFALEGEIVSAFDYFMRNGDFMSHPYFQWRPEGLPPEDARFVVMGQDLVLEADLQEASSP